MSLLSAMLLGAVQGVTEFLPVSSSAHLILVRAFFGWDADQLGLAFDVACHVGTLIAVLAYFSRDIVAMAAALPQFFAASAGPDVRRIRLIVVGTLPIVVVGLLFADLIEERTRTPLVAATALVAGAALLLLIERLPPRGGGEERLTAGGAFLIGSAQSLALIPGVSRSGATIAAGMALGLRREVAARFTFLMSIPAILAAAAKEGLALRHLPFTSTDATMFAVGIGTSALVGYLTIKYFIRFLASHRLDVFAWYRLALGGATFAWLLTR